jgi:hypothetical protein
MLITWYIASIIGWLHGTLMVWICVLCVTFMVFIYAYYRLFACINLVDVMSLFCTVFSFQWSILWKIWPIFHIIRPEISKLVFDKIRLDNSVNSTKFWFSYFSMFLSSAVFWPNFPGFHQIFPKFTIFDGFGTKQIFITHPIFKPWFIYACCYGPGRSRKK